MGCRPVAVVIMHVHEYEIRIYCTNPKFNMAPIQKLKTVNMPKCSFSFLLDFGTNPKFNKASIQKLQKVNMPECSYSIHIFLALD
jgi:hypothetical protein